MKGHSRVTEEREIKVENIFNVLQEEDTEKKRKRKKKKGNWDPNWDH